MKTINSINSILLILLFCGLSYSKPDCSKLFRINIASKWGFIDCKGKIVVKPKFESMPFFEDGLAIVDFETRSNEPNSKMLLKSGVVDLKGNLTVFDDGHNLLSGFSEEFIFGSHKSSWVFFDVKGNVVLRFDNLKLKEEEGTPMIPLAFGFEEGIAGLYAKTGGIYFINKKGEIINFYKDFLDCKGFTDGKAIVSTEKGYGVIDTAGNFIVEPSIGNIDYNEGIFIREKESGGWDYFSIEPNSSWSVDFDYADIFSENLAVVENNEKWGYIGKNGKIIISLKFDDASNFSEGLAAVEINGKYGFIDKKGRFVIVPKYLSVESFDGGLSYVQGNKYRGYINKEGNWIWKTYSHIQPN
jgi:WG containing repeat